VKAVDLQKEVKEPINRLNPVKLCHQNLCKSRSSLALSNLVRTTTLFGGSINFCLFVPQRTFRPGPFQICSNCSRFRTKSAVNRFCIHAY